MSLTQPEQGDSRAVSPGLTLNLSSNNPFRNRAASPAFSSGHASPLEPPRPVSRNPFLDSNSAVSSFPQPPVRSPENMAFGDSKEAPRPALTGNAAELFDNLSLEDKPTTRRPPPPRSNTNENVNPGPRRRPSRSQEEAMRARKPGGPSSRPRPPKDELNIFADPSDSPKKERRARRNSDSSVARDKPLDSDEEKRRQERRRRERERRHQERKTGKKPKNLDVIDKLDVTSIYGTGLFHHDGPFDACNPDRNRKGSQRAPMSAFAKDSLNNVLGGGGPLNKNPDHSTLMGYHDEDAFQDFSGAANDPYANGAIRPDGPARNQSHIVDALSRVEPIHGDESLGLGTSTFLEGAPASYKAIQQNKAEQAQSGGLEGGLGRKKSLAQKIRGISNNRREYGPAGRVTSPDGVYSPEPPSYTPGGSKINDKDPFAAEFSGKDRGETSITIAEPDRKQGRARAPSSPRRGSGGLLERRMTSEGIAGADQASAPAKSGGGFLTRMKSLKGGPRKPRDGPKIPASQPEAV